MTSSWAVVVLATRYPVGPLPQPYGLLLLGAALLPSAAINLVYCRLCEGIQVRWAILKPVAITLFCGGIGCFVWFVAIDGYAFGPVTFLLHLPVLSVTAGFNLVLCRYCKGIQTDWLIVLLIAYFLVNLGLGVVFGPFL
jgi:hypothetical protein